MRLWFNCRPSSASVDKASLIVLILSGLANAALAVLFIVNLLAFYGRRDCGHEYSIEASVKEDAALASHVFPVDSTQHLSEVIMVLHESSGVELINLKKSLEYWQKYPPCVHNGYPTNWANAHCKMVFLFDAVPSLEVGQAVAQMYYDLPRAVRSCFKSMEIRHANVPPPPLTNGTVSDISKLAEAERNLFTKIFTNEIGLSNPSYSLLLTSDTMPVQANWLNLFDYETRVPNERFWIKSSLYRGPIDSRQVSQQSLATMSKVGLYNLGDPAFGTFYTSAVRPFVEDVLPASARHKPVEWDWINYLFQFEHYSWARMMASLFRPTDSIQDYSGAAIDLERLQHEHPDTLLVKGQFPEPSQELHN